MKKTAFSTALILAVTNLCTASFANRVTYPGFHDEFTVTVDPSVTAAITYQGQQGTIYNDPDSSQLYCSNNICHFTVTDDNDWASAGVVNYLIGDQTKKGPYCMISIRDGATYNEAILSSQCANGASTTEMLHNDNHYQFTIN